MPEGKGWLHSLTEARCPKAKAGSHTLSLTEELSHRVANSEVWKKKILISSSIEEYKGWGGLYIGHP